MRAKLGLTALASLGVLLVPFFAAAQPTAGPYIGFLSPASAASMAPRLEAFRQGLRELGYRENENIVIEYRWAEGRDDRLGSLAVELVGFKPRMILVHGVLAAQAAQRASAEIPIVCFACGDVIGPRLVANLARPGGNITGITMMNPQVSGKRLEFLREVLPGLQRVAVLFNSTNPVSVSELKETEEAASALGFQVQPYGVADAGHFEAAFSAMTKSGTQALIVLSDAMFFGRRVRISELAVGHKLPAISWTGEFARAGSLLGYGPDVYAVARRAAYYVDRVLKGFKPGELPIEQPSKFEFVINLKTAKAIGLSVPQSLVLRADDVVQ